MTVSLKPLEQSVYLTQMRAQQLPMAFGGWTPDYLDVTMWTDYFGLGDRSIASISSSISAPCSARRM